MNTEQEIHVNDRTVSGKPSLLLHACCGPCATSCLERLAWDYEITAYYYNPNITDREEYLLRKETLINFIDGFNELHKGDVGGNTFMQEYEETVAQGKSLDILNSVIKDKAGKTFTPVKLLEGPYDTDNYLAKTVSLKDEPERGKRCDVCFAMRLEETAVKADELGYDFFTTTMSVSPHKNYEKIKLLGDKLAEDRNIEFLDVEFKKKNGFARSIQLSKSFKLYRQNFCGCEYARKKD